MKKAFINLIRSVSLGALVVAAPLYAMEPEVPVARASTQAPFLGGPKSPEFQSFLRTFRDHVAADEEKEVSFLCRPNKGSMLFMGEIEGYVASLPESPEKKRLKRELVLHGENGQMSPASLLGIYFRAAHLRGDPSQAEKEIFNHGMAEMDPTTQSFGDGLSDLHSWEHLMTFFFWNNLFAEENESFPRLKHADYNVIPVIEVILMKKYPAPLFLPVIKGGKFPISFMIECNLDNVFPMAFGERSIKAHGVDVTVVGLAFHDLVHGLSTTAYKAMKEHLIRTTDAAVFRGEDADDFIQFYAPKVVEKYKKLMQDLKGVYEFIKTLPEPEKKPALAGFFWMLHEASPFDAIRIVESESSGSGEICRRQDDIFNVSTLEDQISMLVQKSQSILSNRVSWESPTDPLRTAPLTGLSSVTDAEIIDTAYGQIFPRGEKDREALKFTLKKSQQFIDVTLSERNGWKKTVSFATLAHKWRNVDDSLAILNYAGKGLTKPNLTDIGDSVEQREVAMNFLGIVQTELLGLLDLFKEKALLSLKQ